MDGLVYGMVNKAVEEMICLTHGEPMWERVKLRAGVDVDVFISNEAYPDNLTYQLIAALAELSDTPQEEILKAFGEHWLNRTAADGYGALMEAGGSTLPEFLANLPNLHSRITLIHPGLEPPHFTVESVGTGSLRLHYRTHRPGLTPFVVGLLQGLGQRFSTPVRVHLDQSRDAGADHDIFLVEW